MIDLDGFCYYFWWRFFQHYKLRKYVNELEFGYNQITFTTNLGLSNLVITETCLWQTIFWSQMTILLHTVEQGCTTQISWRAKKNFCTYPRAKMSYFYPLKGCVYQENKLEAQYLMLSGPNEKLPRATFGPRAVCCACLQCKRMHKPCGALFSGVYARVSKVLDWIHNATNGKICSLDNWNGISKFLSINLCLHSDWFKLII